MCERESVEIAAAVGTTLAARGMAMELAFQVRGGSWECSVSLQPATEPINGLRGFDAWSVRWQPTLLNQLSYYFNIKIFEVIHGTLQQI